MQTKKWQIAFDNLNNAGNIVCDCNTVQIKNRGTATATLTLGTKSITLLPGEWQIFGGYEFAKGTQIISVTFDSGTANLEIIKQTFIDI